MKTFVLKTLFTILSMSVFLNINADQVYQKLTLPVSIISISFGEFEDDEPDLIGPGYTHRIPSGTTICNISKGAGVRIADGEVEVTLYEIRTPDGETPIFQSKDETEFTSLLFSLSGDFELRFYTADHLYIGYVTLK